MSLRALIYQGAAISIFPYVIPMKPVLDLIGECEASSPLIFPTFIHLIIYFIVIFIEPM